MRIEKFLSTSPIFALYVAYDRIIGDFQKKLQEEDVHFLQALILTSIFFEDRPVRPTELANTLQSTKSNISHSLRSLERSAWIERKSIPGDARAYVFVLTREGKRKVTRLIKLFDSVQEQIENFPGGKRLNRSLKLFVGIYSRIRFP